MRFIKASLIILFITFGFNAIASSKISNVDLQTGLDYFHGNGVKQSYSKAIKYFESAGQNNESDGYLFLGYMYQSEIGVKRDFEQSDKFYKLAAEKGSLEARFQLALSKKGEMVLASFDVGNKYNELKKAYVTELLALSEMGHIHSRAIVAMMYVNGDIEFDNFKKAEGINQKLFDQNNDLATLINGILLIEKGNENDGWVILDNLSQKSPKLIKEYITGVKKRYFNNEFSKTREAFGYRISDSLTDFLTSNTESFGIIAELLQK
jgi:tetratricopeptide (TPR) repeat protein